MTEAQSVKATMEDIRGSLDELVDAYERVQNTLDSLITDAVDMKEDIRVIEDRVNNELTERVTSTRLWRGIAKIHRDKVAKLLVKIELLTNEGHKIEMNIPLLSEVLEAIPELVELIEAKVEA